MTAEDRYLLDTNVLSDLVRKTPSPRLIDQLERHRDRLVTASAVIFEMIYGLERLSPSRRRQAISQHIDSIRRTLPILAYDERAAVWHGRQRRKLEATGISIPFVDGQIAAVAWANRCVLVTENLRHFECFAEIQVESWIG